MSLRVYWLSGSMCNVQWSCFNLVDTCNITLILFLKCVVTKFRILHPSLDTMSHFGDPSAPLSIYSWWQNWIYCFATDVETLFLKYSLSKHYFNISTMSFRTVLNILAFPLQIFVYNIGCYSLWLSTFSFLI